MHRCVHPASSTPCVPPVGCCLLRPPPSQRDADRGQGAAGLLRRVAEGVRGAQAHQAGRGAAQGGGAVGEGGDSPGRGGTGLKLERSSLIVRRAVVRNGERIATAVEPWLYSLNCSKATTVRQSCCASPRSALGVLNCAYLCPAPSTYLSALALFRFLPFRLHNAGNRAGAAGEADCAAGEAMRGPGKGQWQVYSRHRTGFRASAR